ncbi:calcium/sodium antiporter [Altererythrobacter confluentis]|uniref:Calcium/sodium antiporter n=1 Tax=Allopontixanthobacter confluentis TaxID=1849021 RepID=A0A6L7GBX5_9SPHN|nr:calcium/sodium antiporter [Allopontixanthobacter confluentis]MXP13562.1 calcium/sodium antiporter [Allopontixanthobacter confluentis]
MTMPLLMCLAGLVGLGLGGDWLVKGAVGIARRAGMSNLLTGLVIVGFATSMPELVTSVEAALAGSPGIAWGNIIGSNIANALLILGATALVAPIILTGTGRRDAVVALLASVLVWILAMQGLASVWLGLGLLALTIVYIVWRYRYPRFEEGDDDEADGEAELSVPRSLFWLAIGLAALVAGGQALVTGAIEIAGMAGISETVIGLTVVAVGTSLPELAASVAAAMRGKSALAIGNVVGSNIYNLLVIGGVTLVISPRPIPLEMVDMELPVMAASALVILVMCWFGRRISRVGGALLLAAFAINTALLFA